MTAGSVCSLWLCRGCGYAAWSGSTAQFLKSHRASFLPHIPSFWLKLRTSHMQGGCTFGYWGFLTILLGKDVWISLFSKTPVVLEQKNYTQSSKRITPASADRKCRCLSRCFYLLTPIFLKCQVMGLLIQHQGHPFSCQWASLTEKLPCRHRQRLHGLALLLLNAESPFPVGPRGMGGLHLTTR